MRPQDGGPLRFRELVIGFDVRLAIAEQRDSHHPLSKGGPDQSLMKPCMCPLTGSQSIWPSWLHPFDPEWLENANCRLGSFPHLAPLETEQDVRRAQAVAGGANAASLLALTLVVYEKEDFDTLRTFGSRFRDLSETPQPRHWRLLGYDAMSSDQVSLLSGYSWFDKVTPETLEDFQLKLNAHNLFDSAADVRRCALVGNSVCCEEGPFFPFGLWDIGSIDATQ